jgi:ketosteroid isomerase-like protein
MSNPETVMTLERLEAFLQAWTDHDLDVIVECFTEDGVFHASVGPELMGATYRGREDVRRGVQAFFDRYPDGRFEDSSAWVAGGRGAAEWTFVSTGPDGAEVATRGCDLFEFEGDRIRVKNAFRKTRPA